MGADAVTTQFAAEIKPILEAHCVGCHSTDDANGGIDFSRLSDEPSLRRGRKAFRRALEQVKTRQMPPQGEESLTDKQRETLAAWLGSAISHEFAAQGPRDPGAPIVRRLNRTEYGRTLRDLTKLDFNVVDAVGLPDDSGGDRFDNLAAALSLPQSLVEKYFAAADQVLERMFAHADPKLDFLSIDDQSKARGKKAYEFVVFVKPTGATPEKAGKAPAAKPAEPIAPRDAARQVLERFASRAYRRPLVEGELDRLLKLFDAATNKGESFDTALRMAMKPVLMSPYFLLRIEQNHADASGPVAISDYELATRLSYFLWSTMPDEELFRLAAAKELSRPEVLEQQVRRMLTASQAEALTDNFAGQWLQLRKLNSARPSTEHFPAFTNNLRRAMQDETTMFFNKLREEDRSLLELLDADYTYANAELAKHYGLPKVEGNKHQRVTLRPEDHRGGLLGMGSVLSFTSHNSRTSPTLRGQWILAVIFGTPPPPPPANVSQIKEEKDKTKVPKTFREQLAQHASNATCAGCHKKMDPLGFALDNYDGIGGWREATADRPLDTSGQLPTGEKINGVAELKKLILSRSAEFERNLVEQMLSYALGRELDYVDQRTIDETMAALEKNGHRFSTLILGIVQSHAFTHRRPIKAEPDGGSGE